MSSKLKRKFASRAAATSQWIYQQMGDARGYSNRKWFVLHWRRRWGLVDVVSSSFRKFRGFHIELLNAVRHLKFRTISPSFLHKRRDQYAFHRGSIYSALMSKNLTCRIAAKRYLYLKRILLDEVAVIFQTCFDNEAKLFLWSCKSHTYSCGLVLPKFSYRIFTTSRNVIKYRIALWKQRRQHSNGNQWRGFSSYSSEGESLTKCEFCRRLTFNFARMLILCVRIFRSVRSLINW